MARGILLSAQLPEVLRTDITKESVEIIITPAQMRKIDDITANIPNAPTGSHLGITSGTHGSASPLVVSSDAGDTTVTQKLRFTFPVPPEYDNGQNFLVRIYGAMAGAASASATVDVTCYKQDNEAGIGSDLCLTAAQSINSTSYATKDFTIDPTGLVSGDVLDIAVTFAATDVGGTGKTAQIGKLSIVLDIRG